MKMKRIISLFLVLAMSLGLLTGCGGKKTNVEELPEGTVTLTVGIPQNANTTSYDDNAFTNWLEEQANVEIEFEYYSSTESEFQQQLALQASANEPLPDMLLNINMNAHSIQAYGEDGYFIDLKDYVDEYAVNYKKGFEALDETTKNYHMRCPEIGAFIGWKVCYGRKIVQLLIPADARRIQGTTPEIKCEKAKVLSIRSVDFKESFEEAHSYVDENFIYRRGQMVYAVGFTGNRFEESGGGIHVWLDRDAAIAYLET